MAAISFDRPLGPKDTADSLPPEVDKSVRWNPPGRLPPSPEREIELFSQFAIRGGWVHGLDI